MTPTIDLILSHRSIRQFTEQALSAEQLNAIIDAARAASTSSFLQMVSIIRVTDAALRQQLVSLSGKQQYVAQAPEFLVFCADFNRHQQIYPDAQLGYAEQLLTGAIDSALMGQNALLAAESLGLGGVFIGGLRNHIQQVTAALQLPTQVIPLFGLCIGYPAQDPQHKPRLPQEMILHTNYYQPVDRAVLQVYDTEVEAYYRARGSHNKLQNWSQHVAATLSKETRPFMLDYLHSQGWITR
ncbi:MAG: oxygen-insensitive NADPH nitroreductase [Plesiomonas sp.]|uniref:oxygen-insensitive NADPH nitroreductase n=1 Tax=Plesiomonas sp. TaxID=2486279 RepID=UPI003F3CCD62